MGSDGEGKLRGKKQRKEREKDSDKDLERESKRIKRDKELSKPPKDRGAAYETQIRKTDGHLDKEQTARDLTEGKPRANEGNGEVSLSIEETNRVRISLGLKPLEVNRAADEEKEARAAAASAKAEEQKAAKEAEIAERIRLQKEKRAEQEKLRKVKTLGEAGEDVDDIAEWVNRNKKAEERAKEAERLKAAKLARQLEEQDDIESDEETVTNATELAGMKVKHSADELNEGETMILTLADRGILDDKGDIAEDGEELENSLVTEEKLRKKALKAATKDNKPLFGEDGKVRGLLEKYDEEQEEEGMQIDATGAIEEAKRKKHEEIRARLRAAESAATSSAPRFSSGGDYYTKEEMAQFQKPKTKKKRKLRKKETDTEEGGLDLAALEAEAAATDTGKDRGSRAQKSARDAELSAAQTAELQKRRERYDNALNKANIASLALQQREAEEAVDDDADDLQASLARARRAALLKSETSKRPSAEHIAAEAAKRREERERQEQEQGGGLEFSEAKDFANSIQVVAAQEPPVAATEPAEMHEQEKKPPTPPPELPPMPLPPPPPVPDARSGSWVPADKVKEEPAAKGKPRAAVIVKEEAPESLVRERTVGSGLAGAMALLRDRGELQQKVEWAGRTNDMKKEKLQGLDDIYQGGRHEDKLAADIEQALTERDEFGRVLTPKERFRRLCHNFHGKTISKGKQEKRLRKLQEEMDAKRAATGEGARSRLGGTQISGTPYMVLSGKVQPGQTSDPAAGFATIEKHGATPALSAGGATPLLGGGVTPLVGDRKVEVMLGMRREQAASQSKMAPPAPRNVRK